MVEGNVFGNTTLPDPAKFNEASCRASQGSRSLAHSRAHPLTHWLTGSLARSLAQLGVGSGGQAAGPWALQGGCWQDAAAEAPMRPVAVWEAVTRRHPKAPEGTRRHFKCAWLAPCASGRAGGVPPPERADTLWLTVSPGLGCNVQGSTRWRTKVSSPLKSAGYGTKFAPHKAL